MRRKKTLVDKSGTIKIVGICGSPHRNGNTARLIRKVLEGAQSIGAKTQFFSLGDKKLLFCAACYKCVEHGHCVIKDDLDEIRKMMLECDGIVIGSPTYNREITGQMKTFFDRMWFDIHRETFLGKHAVCVNTYNLITGHSMRTLKELTLALGYSIVGCVRSSSLARFNGEVEKDLKSLEESFRMGIKLVKAIQRKKKYFSQEVIRRFIIRSVIGRIDDFLSSSEIVKRA